MRITLDLTKDEILKIIKKRINVARNNSFKDKELNKRTSDFFEIYDLLRTLNQKIHENSQ